jgi:preprotein translocase SecE subunit
MAEIEKEETMAADEVVETEAEAQETPIAEPEVPATVTKESKGKKKDKNAKPNFFVRLGRRIAKFFRDYNSERKKVVWKPWAEVCKSAGIVVVTVAAFSAVIYGIDEAFGNLFLWLAKLINL